MNHVYQNKNDMNSFDMIWWWVSSSLKARKLCAKIKQRVHHKTHIVSRSQNPISSLIRWPITQPILILIPTNYSYYLIFFSLRLIVFFFMNFTHFTPHLIVMLKFDNRMYNTVRDPLAHVPHMASCNMLLDGITKNSSSSSRSVHIKQ